MYRVRDNKLGKVYALKLLVDASPSIRARLKDEGRLQASLRHPNIVEVHDILDVQDELGLIMESPPALTA